MFTLLIKIQNNMLTENKKIKETLNFSDEYKTLNLKATNSFSNIIKYL